MSKRRNPKTKTWTDIFQSERRTWGSINPVTRVVPDKRFRKLKHKGRELDY